MDANKHENMLNLIKSGKCKLKMQWNAILHPLAWQKMENSSNPQCLEGCSAIRASIVLDRVGQLEKQGNII